MFFFALQLAIVSNSVPPTFNRRPKLVARVGFLGSHVVSKTRRQSFILGSPAGINIWPNITTQMPPKVTFTQHMPSQADHLCSDASESRICTAYAFSNRIFMHRCLQSRIYTTSAFSSRSFLHRCLSKSYLHSRCLLKSNISAQMPPKVVFTQHMPSQAEHYCIDASQSRIYSVYAFPSRTLLHILVVPPTLCNRCCLVCLLRCECNAVELLR